MEAIITATKRDISISICRFRLIKFCLAMKRIKAQDQLHKPLIIDEDTASLPISELRSFRSARRHAMTWKELKHWNDAIQARDWWRSGSMGME